MGSKGNSKNVSGTSDKRLLPHVPPIPVEIKSI
jgi:hypothetical protein